MPRPRTTRPDLPPRLHARVQKKRTLYYYRAGGKSIPLGADLAQAKRRWAELETAGAPDTATKPSPPPSTAACAATASNHSTKNI